MSRCRPNTREASRTLIPFTITARRTRRYTSTLCIRRTIRRVGYNPCGWRRAVQFTTAVCQQSIRPRGPIYLRRLHLAPLSDDPDDLYRTNIQISELNALNACLAVIRYKQLRGFYFEEVAYHHLVMEVGDLKTAGEFELSED